MTAAERAEECVNEGAGVAMPEPPQEQTEEQCAAPKEVTVDSVITVDTVVLQDGKVEDTCHEEVNVKQTFTPEEPMPYGPDEGLTQEGKEDEEECGFCLFMKAGPCGKRFAAWEACVDSAETAGINNLVEKCAQTTHYLKECMEANPDYYGPVLQAEKAMDEQATMEAKAGTEEAASNNESQPLNF